MATEPGILLTDRGFEYSGPYRPGTPGRNGQGIEWWKSDSATTRPSSRPAWTIRGLGSKYSFFLYPFITACCGMEFMAVAGPRYDIDRFGAALPRFSPRQADLLMVVGTISHKQAPVLRKVYDQMCEPKWVMAFGGCTCSGGPYDNYATVQGIDTIIPVDIYVIGCPPRPEAVLDGLIKLQERVSREPVPSTGRHVDIDNLPLLDAK
jgi:NADH-quinone oxidoreductase subunit B